MLNDRSQFRCDAEIGSCKRGWHSCGKPAVVQAVRRVAGIPIYTDYCESHRHKATEEQRTIERELLSK